MKYRIKAKYHAAVRPEPVEGQTKQHLKAQLRDSGN
jgi:hypothetical protein